METLGWLNGKDSRARTDLAGVRDVRGDSNHTSFFKARGVASFTSRGLDRAAVGEDTRSLASRHDL